MRYSGNGQDEEIIRLLGKLKDGGPEYPPRLFTARRAAIIAALAALPLGGALAVGFFSKLAHTIKAMSMIDKIILAVEATAIIGVGTVGVTEAYVYRRQIQALLFPTAVVTPFPTLSSSSPVPGAPLIEGTPSGTTTPTATPTGTLLFVATGQPGSEPTSVINTPVNTPVDTLEPPKPTATPPCGDGNCYGKVTRTPKPPPTKKP